MHPETEASPQPDLTEPTLARQAELCRARSENSTAGRAPYAGVALLSRGELEWVLQTEGWSGEYRCIALGQRGRRCKHGLIHRPIDLRAAYLVGVNLGDTCLWYADLTRADLTKAVLGPDAKFNRAVLEFATCQVHFARA